MTLVNDSRRFILADRRQSVSFRPSSIEKEAVSLQVASGGASIDQNRVASGSRHDMGLTPVPPSPSLSGRCSRDRLQIPVSVGPGVILLFFYVLGSQRL